MCPCIKTFRAYIRLYVRCVHQVVVVVAAAVVVVAIVVVIVVVIVAVVCFHCCRYVCMLVFPTDTRALCCLCLCVSVCVCGVLLLCAHVPSYVSRAYVRGCLCYFACSPARPCDMYYKK